MTYRYSHTADIDYIAYKQMNISQSFTSQLFHFKLLLLSLTNTCNNMSPVLTGNNLTQSQHTTVILTS